MDKDAAIEAMEQGKKITHRYFRERTYIMLNENGLLIDETGYVMDTFPPYHSDWTIYTSK